MGDILAIATVRHYERAARSGVDVAAHDFAAGGGEQPPAGDRRVDPRVERTPRQLMGYSGAVAAEASSGARPRRGGITKTGNAHLRRIVIEAAWAYRYRPSIGPTLRKRQATLPEDVKEIAWKAQHRLHARYRVLMARGKCKQQVVTAVGRELLGFIWAIGVAVEGREALAA